MAPRFFPSFSNVERQTLGLLAIFKVHFYFNRHGKSRKGSAGAGLVPSFLLAVRRARSPSSPASCPCKLSPSAGCPASRSTPGAARSRLRFPPDASRTIAAIAGSGRLHHFGKHRWKFGFGFDQWLLLAADPDHDDERCGEPIDRSWISRTIL
jgi:hypothetical protein